MLIAVNLTGKLVVIVGSSPQAINRARSIASDGAVVRLVSPDAIEPIEKTFGSISVVRRRKLKSSDFKGAFLVIATDRDRTTNEFLFAKSKKYGFLLNTLDEPVTSNFYHTATRRIGDSFEIAVSTNGISPAFASRMSSRIESLISNDDIEVFDAFRNTRKLLREQGLSTFDFDWDLLEDSVRGESDGNLGLQSITNPNISKSQESKNRILTSPTQVRRD